MGFCLLKCIFAEKFYLYNYNMRFTSTASRLVLNAPLCRNFLSFGRYFFCSYQ